jgi:hypothetical protein
LEGSWQWMKEQMYEWKWMNQVSAFEIFLFKLKWSKFIQIATLLLWLDFCILICHWLKVNLIN